MTNMMKQRMLQKLSVNDLTLRIQQILRGNDTLGVKWLINRCGYNNRKVCR